jgi:hypothetical protein
MEDGGPFLGHIQLPQECIHPHRLLRASRKSDIFRLDRRQRDCRLVFS